MKVIIQDNTVSLIRFDKGDDVLAALSSLAEKENITAATFTAIGASGEVILSYYDIAKKEYVDREFREDLEIVSITGNVGRMDSKPIIHAHGVFSDREFKTYGGHLKKLIVSATCEVTLTQLKGEILRGFDNETGLNLMK
jgi:uncharacterized protein